MRVQLSLQCNVEAPVLGAGAVKGEVERLFDERVQIGCPTLAAAAARMQQHAGDDAVGPAAMLGDLRQIARQGRDQLALLAAGVSIVSSSSCSSSRESSAKLLTKFSGFSISWAMPAVS